MRRPLSLGVIATTLLLGAPADAQQETTDMKLRSAGFKVRLADTPEQLEKLRRLPARTIVSRTRNGKRLYVYADPDYCKCVLIGNDDALKTYRDMTSMVPRPDNRVPGGRLGDSEGMVINEMDSDLGDNDIFGDSPFPDTNIPD